MEHWSNVPGNSGCIVEIEMNAVSVVRKRALTPQYAPRLQIQCQKQRAFTSPLDKIIAPKVIAMDETSFTMERLIMLDAIEFMERSAPQVIMQRMESILELVRWEFASSRLVSISENLFMEKMESIEKNVPPAIWGEYYQVHARHIKNNLQKEITVPVGICHGDLTFSNIMFSMDKELVGLIDFLDSYLDSPLIDLAKLRQDTCFHWTSSRYLKPHDTGKIHLINSWLNKMIWKRFHDELSSVEFRVVEALNYLRIAPYAKTSGEHLFLSRALNQIHNPKESM